MKKRRPKTAEEQQYWRDMMSSLSIGMLARHLNAGCSQQRGLSVLHLYMRMVVPIHSATFIHTVSL